MSRHRNGGAGGDRLGLDELDITADEFGRLQKAFKQDEFRQLFAEYVDEISDPANQRIFESELTQLEAERGIGITFIHPTPGYVLKTISGGTQKTFINVASSERIERPSSSWAHNGSGDSGLNWSLPYAQSPLKKDYDKQQSVCLVYDVLFHPDTLHLAGKNANFKQLVSMTALEAVRDMFAPDLDMVNVRSPKMAYKGMARSTVIRKRAERQPDVLPEPSPLDAIYPPLASETAKPATAAASPPKPVKADSKADASNGAYTTPRHTIVHRKLVEYHEMTDELDAKAGAAIPHELEVSVELPLVRDLADIVLDVTGDGVFVTTERPAKYMLRVRLPYAVCPARGRARFVDRRLVVTLPVNRSAPTVQQIVDAGRYADAASDGVAKVEEVIADVVKVVEEVKENVADEVLEEVVEDCVEQVTQQVANVVCYFIDCVPYE